ncbi:hypothetical protein [Actibacterium sp. 188UL27-1]|uniref:hypothetical protein n=1 Tax=Actibacterium sp. 188UL27-1 TaxID=2786961 RepID=UPI001956629F|nr:hypothetical protein [Actibacterium sp. 188UL27-1]MBM7069055.1 hypothetical protein [Actibacterium sp. 188UL27-1]
MPDDEDDPYTGVVMKLTPTFLRPGYFAYKVAAGLSEIFLVLPPKHLKEDRPCQWVGHDNILDAEFLKT